MVDRNTHDLLQLVLAFKDARVVDDWQQNKLSVINTCLQEHAIQHRDRLQVQLTIVRCELVSAEHQQYHEVIGLVSDLLNGAHGE